MRINVYAEELTDDVQVVSKDVTDAEFGTRTFYGVRMFLASPDELHHSPDDDDRSAITFWVPWTSTRGNNPARLEAILEKLVTKAARIPAGPRP